MRPAALLLVLGVSGCTNGVGELCASNRPCPPSLECVRAGDTSDTGICDYPLAGFGARCELASQCEPGLTCSSHFTPGERYGTCVHQRDVGEPCAVDRDCLSGRCDSSLTPGAQGRCAP